MPGEAEAEAEAEAAATGGDDVTTFAGGVGSTVTITGLTAKPELNGARGTIRSRSENGERWVVQLACSGGSGGAGGEGPMLALKPGSLLVELELSEEEAPGVGKDGATANAAHPLGGIPYWDAKQSSAIRDSGAACSKATQNAQAEAGAGRGEGVAAAAAEGKEPSVAADGAGSAAAAADTVATPANAKPATAPTLEDQISPPSMAGGNHALGYHMNVLKDTDGDHSRIRSPEMVTGTLFVSFSGGNLLVCYVLRAQTRSAMTSSHSSRPLWMPLTLMANRSLCGMMLCLSLASMRSCAASCSSPQKCCTMSLMASKLIHCF